MPGDSKRFDLAAVAILDFIPSSSKEEGWRVATGWWLGEGTSKVVWFFKHTTPPFGHPSSFHEEG